MVILITLKDMRTYTNIKKSDLKVWAHEPRNNYQTKKLIIQILENFPVRMTNILFKLIKKLFLIEGYYKKTSSSRKHNCF